ncbi:ribosome maturation factor RimP [Deferribacterales bacterium RsTz2092]|nr:ribosome maturation factor RimP [Deferribacterales bacterium]
MLVVNNSVVDVIAPIASELATGQGLKLYGITLQREREGTVMRIMLDSAVEGVSLDRCAAVSRGISAWLDNNGDDFIPFKSYTLEVSSLGIDRPLRDEADFIENIGRLCLLETREKDASGRKRFRGNIIDVSGGIVSLDCKEEGVVFKVKVADVKKAKLEIEL